MLLLWLKISRDFLFSFSFNVTDFQCISFSNFNTHILCPRNLCFIFYYASCTAKCLWNNWWKSIFCLSVFFIFPVGKRSRHIFQQKGQKTRARWFNLILLFPQLTWLYVFFVCFVLQMHMPCNGELRHRQIKMD